ncbi:hypothetical protein [Nocardia brasiliensis]|uniref:hypothetical protein n=1 Tax=Nocardia brasiliensis TaxID=37326 RepID=UPI00130EE564|nr:hypothetical protein [Nocardia brasiliensis]
MDLYTTILEAGRAIYALLGIPLDVDCGWGDLADECAMYLNASAVMSDVSQPILEET